MTTENYITCDGKIQQNGWCDKCGQPAQGTSSYCGRLIQNPTEQPKSAEEILEKYMDGTDNPNIPLLKMAMEEYATLRESSAQRRIKELEEQLEAADDVMGKLRFYTDRYHDSEIIASNPKINAFGFDWMRDILKLKQALEKYQSLKKR